MFVEIGNRKNRENDHYYQILSPFMKKLSNYFRFIHWCQSGIVYPKELNGNENEFKKLISSLSRYGESLIFSGGDYSTNSFTAKELDRIASMINNIWYFQDRMHPCRLGFNSEWMISEDIANKELQGINPMYLTDEKDVYLVAKVSGDFYVDCYQKIEYETYRHEAYMEIYQIHTILVSFYVLIVLVLLSLMLFLNIPANLLRWSTILIIMMFASCLIMLGIDVKKQINWKYNIKAQAKNIKQKMKKALKRCHVRK